MADRVKKIKVLIVEDDPGQQELVSRYLSADGFEVRVIDTPMGATNATREFQPDVILLDLDLPAYTGDKIVPLLRQRGLNTKILVFSASDETRLSSVGRSIKADGWLSKSTPLDILGIKLKQIAFAHG